MAVTIGPGWTIGAGWLFGEQPSSQRAIFGFGSGTSITNIVSSTGVVAID